MRRAAGSRGLLLAKPQNRWPNMPYGIPIKGMDAHIMLKDCKQEAPVNVWGEICFSGVGVSRGYLGDPVRTKERFVHHPETGIIMHRTGDLGKLTRQGYLLIAGRIDNQVKVNGFRIELGEIEAVLANFAGVKHAGVILSGSAGRQQLVACIQPNAEWKVAEDRSRNSEGEGFEMVQESQFQNLADFLREYPNPKISPIVTGLYKSQLFGVRRNLHSTSTKTLICPAVINFFAT